MNRSTWIAALGTISAALALPALAQTVKVTPLGGIEGEFCQQDRALVFEDPNGTRVLYDPGRTVAGAGDPANSILARFGGSVTIGGVRIATVAALHSNGLDPEYFGGELGKAMKEAGLADDVGLATGYVLRFSNGLVAYLSGDTGITADQELVVRNHYNAKLAVMNMGDGFTTGPVEAAYVINDLVKPASVIASHANEVGTVGGKVRPGSKTEAFMKAVKVPVHIPLSGKTMEFDAAGKCAAGC